MMNVWFTQCKISYLCTHHKCMLVLHLAMNWVRNASKISTALKHSFIATFIERLLLEWEDPGSNLVRANFKFLFSINKFKRFLLFVFENLVKVYFFYFRSESKNGLCSLAATKKLLITKKLTKKITKGLPRFGSTYSRSTCY